jgi:hypothetical protein
MTVKLEGRQKLPRSWMELLDTNWSNADLNSWSRTSDTFVAKNNSLSIDRNTKGEGDSILVTRN